MKGTAIIAAALNTLSVIACSRKQETVKWEGGDGDGEGSLDPSKSNKCHKEPPKRGSGGVDSSSQTPFLNPDPFQ